MSESTPITPPNHPLHSPGMKEIISTMPPNVQELYADYMLAFSDEGTPGYEKRLSVLRHAVANAINLEMLKEEAAKQEKQTPP